MNIQTVQAEYVKLLHDRKGPLGDTGIDALEAVERTTKVKREYFVGVGLGRVLIGSMGDAPMRHRSLRSISDHRRVRSVGMQSVSVRVSSVSIVQGDSFDNER
jgi:hypothetical protein